MNPLTLQELSKHPFVLASAAGAAVLMLFGGGYYLASSRVPSVAQMTSASTTAITASGVVAPAQSPNLSFQSGGRVAKLASSIGGKVYRGQTLATLDLTALYADRARAAAALQAQEANLASLQAGARDVDVALKQTGVDQANTSLQNLYTTISTALEQARDKAYSNVTTYTYTLFSQPNSAFPTLGFITSNAQAVTDSNDMRIKTMSTLSVWQNELQSLSTDRAAIENELHSSVAHLEVVRRYANELLVALASALSSSSFTQAQITTAQTQVSSVRDTINAQISALQSLDQQLSAAKLALQSAQNGLSQTKAGATKEAIAAQEAQVASARANVASVDAQIHNASVIAPFSGTVSAVHKKVGDVVMSGEPIISLNPDSSLEITVYLNEIDAARVAQGTTADVTLDAYGTSRHFAATVVSVDRSPASANAAQGYRVVLQFNDSDKSISSGMTANITINVQ